MVFQTSDLLFTSFRFQFRNELAGGTVRRTALEAVEIVLVDYSAMD